MLSYPHIKINWILTLLLEPKICAVQCIYLHLNWQYYDIFHSNRNIYKQYSKKKCSTATHCMGMDFEIINVFTSVIDLKLSVSGSLHTICYYIGIVHWIEYIGRNRTGNIFPEAMNIHVYDADDLTDSIERYPWITYVLQVQF